VAITHLQTCMYVCRAFCAELHGALYNQSADYVVLTKELFKIIYIHIYIVYIYIYIYIYVCVYTHTHTQGMKEQM